MDRKMFAEVKRFRERWTADDRFRAGVLADPAGATATAGFGIDPSPLAFLWRPGAAVNRNSPEFRAFQGIEEQARAYLDFADNDEGAIERYRGWRARQRARAAFAQGFVLSPISLHLPFAVELTQGCSLGCWFCGISATPLKAVLPTDLETWMEMLCALRRIFGASASRGFLFWATDPLDHPDYEAHAEAFARVLGRFPTTTTAAPLANVDRTRRLMALSRAENSPALRFSVVTRRKLDEIHETFSAEELADISLVPVNRESLLGLAEAGRAREFAKQRPERAAVERDKLRNAAAGTGRTVDDDTWVHNTIACVSGFLIEPITGRVRLISPEPCSDRWPDGYAVIDEAHFRDAAEFESALERLVADNMKPDPPDWLGLQRGVTVRAESETRILAEGRGHRIFIESRFRNLCYLPDLAAAFRGGASVNDTVQRFAGRSGMDPRRIRKDLTDLWRQGVLIEPIFAFADIDGARNAAAADMPPPRPRRMTP